MIIELKLLLLYKLPIFLAIKQTSIFTLDIKKKFKAKKFEKVFQTCLGKKKKLAGN